MVELRFYLLLNYKILTGSPQPAAADTTVPESAKISAIKTVLGAVERVSHTEPLILQSGIEIQWARHRPWET